MEQYACDICGKSHPVFRTIKSPAPDLILEIPEEEEETRIHALNEFYIVDKTYLLGNGYVIIELEGFNEPFFYWEIWVSVLLKDFNAAFEAIKNGEAVVFNGILESEIPFYPESRGLELKTTIQIDKETFTEIVIVEESALKEDQSKPISKNRVIALMQ